MARSVYDVALLLNSMAGSDAEDPVTAQPWHMLTRDFTANLNENTAYQLRELRIGVPRKGFVESLTASQLALFEQAIATLRELGIVVIDDIELDTWPLIQNTDVLHYEFKGSLNHYLQMAGAPVSTRATANWRMTKAYAPLWRRIVSKHSSSQVTWAPPMPRKRKCLPCTCRLDLMGRACRLASRLQEINIVMIACCKWRMALSSARNTAAHRNSRRINNDGRLVVDV
jgi:Asp-tRNA(Asn)/Glu-tRNA(Gln) amidotransferase A subunit family amidase